MTISSTIAVLEKKIVIRLMHWDFKKMKKFEVRIRSPGGIWLLKLLLQRPYF
jgi:hypothetical protein